MPSESPSLASIPVAILAGGLATRMRPLTEKIPKSLLPVAGQPFLSHQLALLREHGIRKAVLCVGYLGEMIQERFGRGEQHGLTLDYSFDGPTLRGTGGAIQHALPKLGDVFFVLYGDSYLPIDMGRVAAAFLTSGKAGLMTVYRNEGRYDRSNVVYEKGEIKVYDKKHPQTAMHHIDYGLSIFRASAFEAYSGETTLDLATVMQDLVSRQDMAGLEVEERFYEIGSPQGLQELDDLLQSKSTDRR